MTSVVRANYPYDYETVYGDRLTVLHRVSTNTDVGQDEEGSIEITVKSRDGREASLEFHPSEPIFQQMNALQIFVAYLSQEQEEE